MQIEILGPGCVNCETLAANAKQAVEALGLEADVTKITDIAQITARGVVVTPALAVDGQVAFPRGPKGFVALACVDAPGPAHVNEGERFESGLEELLTVSLRRGKVGALHLVPEVRPLPGRRLGAFAKVLDEDQSVLLEGAAAGRKEPFAVFYVQEHQKRHQSVEAGVVKGAVQDVALPVVHP